MNTIKKVLLAATLAVGVAQGAEQYSCSQMKSLADQYFGSESDLMVCISYFESSWEPSAYNPSGASGLWQIMPEHCGELCPQCTDPSQLFNPEINAQCALNVLRAQGLGAWTTYDNGDCNGWNRC